MSQETKWNIMMGKCNHALHLYFYKITYIHCFNLDFSSWGFILAKVKEYNLGQRLGGSNCYYRVQT